MCLPSSSDAGFDLWITDITTWLAGTRWLAAVDDPHTFARAVLRSITDRGATVSAKTIGRERLLHISAIVYDLCISPDRSRQEQGYTLLGEYLFRAARVIEEDTALAQDATQEALEQTYKKIRSVRHGRLFLWWCKTVLVHSLQALQEARNKRALRYVHLPDDDEREPGETRLVDPEQLSVEQSVDNALRCASLRRWVAETRLLTPRQKRIVQLVFIEEHNTSAVAHMLGISLGALYVALYRAKARLRESIERTDELRAFGLDL